MISSELQRHLREEIKKQVITILSGEAGGGDAETETINNMFPGMPGITKRPVMHPFGFASRAPKKTIQVVGKQGNTPENRIVLGHRDARRPTDLAEGDSAIYSSDGKTVLAYFKIKVDEIHFSTGKGLGVVGQFTKDGKVSVNNQVGDLIAILSDLLKAVENIATDVSTGTVTTLLGEMPLKMAGFIPHLAAFVAAEAKFNTFKKG